jgi:hypothetical protein
VQCPRGGIGRRAWFRSMCREVWGFESLRGHQGLFCCWQYRLHSNICVNAHVAELVDAHGSGPCAARCGGSSPSVGTKSYLLFVVSLYGCLHAHVAELVDAHGSGPCAARCGGSSPSVGTKSYPVVRRTVVWLFVCPRGGIGRRAWFRSMCREVWGFESLRGHQKLPCLKHSSAVICRSLRHSGAKRRNLCKRIAAFCVYARSGVRARSDSCA